MSEPEYDGSNTITGMVAYRARTHRPTREFVASAPGIGAAGVVVWLADLLGHRIPPDVAVYLGSLITSGVSWFIRHQFDKREQQHQ